ncbi:hypothetical protein [Actinoplanes sp. NPDC023714]|uniref:hypothetical protein n=1 Tax=Actinoplanes sp. NPDC023714 TaxID=3154322 RepID=UPI0033C73C15
MSSTDTRTGSADPVRVLLLCLAAVVATIGVLRYSAALALLGGLAVLLLLALTPALAGRPLPRAGLALLAVVLLTWYVPTLGDDWPREQLVRAVIVAVCITAACAALFTGTAPGGGTALGGLFFALLVYASISNAVHLWNLTQDLGEYMGVSVEVEGHDYGVLTLLAAATLLVVGGRRGPVRRSSPAA